MKKVFTRIYKEIQLRGRFAARKMGFTSALIHQICLPEHKLIYIPVPKNACTTIKQALHQIEFGSVFDTGQPGNEPYIDVHDYYKKRSDSFTNLHELKTAADYTRFTLVRDPVERLISCYRNRVVDLGDLHADRVELEKVNLSAEPDLNTFVLNLKRYRKVNKSIEHHTRPQFIFLGGTLRCFDYVFPIEKSEELEKLLRQYSEDLTMLNRKSGGTKVDFSDFSARALSYANTFYKNDYLLLKEFYTPWYH